MRAGQLTEQDSIFDGFAHRNFREDIDGWMNEQPKLSEYPEVKMAYGVIELFEELKAVKRELWHTKRMLELWQKPIS